MDTSDSGVAKRRYHPHHIVRTCAMTLEECLAASDVVVSAVPNASYKVSTAKLKNGCVCVNVSSEKNFEKDVREKVRQTGPSLKFQTELMGIAQASIYVPAVGKVTILMLLRNL